MPHTLLEKPAPEVARVLIGYRLYVYEPDGSLTGGVITETEAYMPEDAASHSYHGKTARNSPMFESAGALYVYFTYGMHWCMNIVTGPEGSGQAVLIRALAADSGLDAIRDRRSNRPDNELTNGPAKVCQALQVTGADNGARIGEGRFVLMPPVPGVEPTVVATPRIGIKQDTYRLWRFVRTTPPETTH